MRSWRRGVVLGAVLAAAAAVLVGAVLVGAQSASASPRCLAWIDSPYFNDDTGASGWTSVCAVEQDGDTGGDPADGSPSDGGGMSAVHVGAPPSDLDPLCKTKVPSLIDQNVKAGARMYATGFPAGTSANPLVVHVSLDTNLSTGLFSFVDWQTTTALALARWQYELSAAGVPITFVLDPTPVNSTAAQLSMWGALGAGDLIYQLHIRAADAGDTMGADSIADTSDLWGDPNGRSLFQEVRLKNIEWFGPKSLIGPDVVIGHEVGHSLGLWHTDPYSPTTTMGAHDHAAQPTCSDAWSAKRAMSQDPVTGYSPLDDGL